MPESMLNAYNPDHILCLFHPDEKSQVICPVVCLVNSRMGVQSFAFRLQSLRAVMSPKRLSSYFMLRIYEAFSDPQKTCHVGGGFWRMKRALDQELRDEP